LNTPNASRNICAQHMTQFHTNLTLSSSLSKVTVTLLL